MDIVEVVTGGFIFNFIGACVRWAYGTTWRTIASKKKYKFSEYLYGLENSDDWFDGGHQFVNRIIGIITLVVLLFLIVY